MLERCCEPYQRLDAVCKQTFRERVALFRMGTEWTPLGWPEERVPVDVQLALSAQAVTLTLQKPVFLFKAFEKVIIYPHSFFSPEYPFMHGSEVFQPDGCLIFSAEHVVKAFVKPNEFYNVGLHEYAKVFIMTYPNEAWPDTSAPDAWERLGNINGMNRAYIESMIGLAGVEVLPVCIHHHFNFPEQLAAAWPEVAEGLRTIFPGTCS
jgi:Glucose-regulated metallo-peptidase M90